MNFNLADDMIIRMFLCILIMENPKFLKHPKIILKIYELRSLYITTKRRKEVKERKGNKERKGERKPEYLVLE